MASLPRFQFKFFSYALWFHFAFTMNSLWTHFEPILISLWFTWMLLWYHFDFMFSSRRFHSLSHGEEEQEIKQPRLEGWETICTQRHNVFHCSAMQIAVRPNGTLDWLRCNLCLCRTVSLNLLRLHLAYLPQSCQWQGTQKTRPQYPSRRKISCWGRCPSSSFLRRSDKAGIWKILHPILERPICAVHGLVGWLEKRGRGGKWNLGSKKWISKLFIQVDNCFLFLAAWAGSRDPWAMNHEPLLLPLTLITFHGNRLKVTSKSYRSNYLKNGLL